MKNSVSIKNKKASFEFSFLVTYQAGMMLSGTEVKSVRDGKASLTDSFCIFIDGELYVKNMHISEYKEGSYSNHEPKRMRKLLLTKGNSFTSQLPILILKLTLIPS